MHSPILASLVHVDAVTQRPPKAHRRPGVPVRLVAASDAADGKGYDVQIGDVPLLDMFPDLPVPPESVLSGRILSVLLGALGAFALLWTHPGRRDPLLALGLGGLAVGAVASMLWLGSNSRMTCVWLTVVAVCIVLTIWRLRRVR